MNHVFNETNVKQLRDLLRKSDNLTDEMYSILFGENYDNVRVIVNKNLPTIRDTNNDMYLVKLLNEGLNQEIETIHPPTSKPAIKDQVINLDNLPPKLRSKMNRSGLSSPLANNNSNGNVTRIGTMQIPTVQELKFDILHSDPGVGRKGDGKEHKIGSLVIIFHDTLGGNYLCRILGSKIINGNKYYLVVFIYNLRKPMYVAPEHLYTKNDHLRFPLSEDEMHDEVSVDWLLERIYSAAQCFVISEGQPYRTSKVVEENYHKVVPLLIKFSAILILCYITAKYEVPKEKIDIIYRIIMDTYPLTFESSNVYMEVAMKKLFVLAFYGGDKKPISETG